MEVSHDISEASHARDIDADTVVSQATTVRGMLANPKEEVAKWIAKLPVLEAMVRLKGVHVHHAEQAEKKLGDKGHIDDAKSLKEHLKLVALSELLHDNQIFGIDDSEFRTACQAASKKVKVLPPVVQNNCLIRHLSINAKLVTDVPSFNSAFAVAWTRPCISEWEASLPAFDIDKNPLVVTLPAQMQLKVDIFAQYFWKGVGTGWVSAGIDKVGVVKEVMPDISLCPMTWTIHWQTSARLPIRVTSAIA